MPADQRNKDMAERSDNVLWYGQKPNGVKAFFAANRRAIILVGVGAVLLLLAFRGIGPTSGQIRLDTGDLRYCWLGVPLQYEQMPEPMRSKIMALASKSPAIPAKWVTCVTYPLPTTNNPDSMCRGFYLSIAIWTDEDPKIARWAMDDVAAYIQHARWGLPNSSLVLSGFVVDWGTHSLSADWRENEGVKAYCSSHGYVPTPAPTASRPK